MSVIAVWLMFMIGCGSEEVIELSELQNRDGLFYKINADKPFTGKAVDFYDNGQKTTEANFINGKKDGKLTQWYKNGQKKEEIDFINGKNHGIFIKWYKNGQKKDEFNFINGETHGKAISWYRNGQKKEETDLKKRKITWKSYRLV